MYKEGVRVADDWYYLDERLAKEYTNIEVRREAEIERLKSLNPVFLQSVVSDTPRLTTRQHDLNASADLSVFLYDSEKVSRADLLQGLMSVDMYYGGVACFAFENAAFASALCNYLIETGYSFESLRGNCSEQEISLLAEAMTREYYLEKEGIVEEAIEVVKDFISVVQPVIEDSETIQDAIIFSCTNEIEPDQQLARDLLKARAKLHMNEYKHLLPKIV